MNTTSFTSLSLWLAWTQAHTQQDVLLWEHYAPFAQLTHSRRYCGDRLSNSLCEISWIFLIFLRFDLIFYLTSKHNIDATCYFCSTATPPCAYLTQPHVGSRVRTASDHWIICSMEHMWICNMSRLLSKLCQHNLLTIFSPATQVLI
jgi:hypothetical protein